MQNRTVLRRASTRPAVDAIAELTAVHVSARFLSMATRWCEKRGLLRFVGVEHARRALRSGRAILASNHPTMLEVCFIPTACHPDYLLDPRCLPWSISDRKILWRSMYWMFPFIRNITIDRDDKEHTVAGLRQAVRILNAGGSIVVYPEGGRTSKGAEFVEESARRIRRMSQTVCAVARMTDATIVPVWVEFTGVEKALGLIAALRWLMRGNRMTIFFGEPYHVYDGALEAARNELEHKILQAGAVGT